MVKIKDRITILAVGDGPDRDTYRKFHKEKPFILKAGFDYRTVSYKRLLAQGTGPFKTEKIIIFLFFPFLYWNEFIEHKNYKGVYGNRAFYEKFIRFWAKADKALRDSLSEKQVAFVNPPLLCGLYRDKLTVAKRFLHTNISSPKLYKISRAVEIRDLLEKGRSFFVKPRYGSMGKGITFLSWSNWQTNFTFKNGRIVSRVSDRGWKFRDITEEKGFLKELLRKDVLIESAVDSLLLKKTRVDLRVYTFFGKVIFVYPRRNRSDAITTNISQGAKGDPNILKELPRNLVKKTW